MKTLLTILKILAGVFLSMSLLITLFALFMVIEKRDNAIVITLIFFVTDALALISFLFIRSKLLRIKTDELENIIFKIANDHGGMITGTELAKDSNLTFEESTEALEKLHRQGICEKKVTDNNVYIYNFTGMITDEEKNNAKQVLSDRFT
ncbi:MAG: hypothetical protein KKC46_00385 [Proteobacteria bacterium]|nr:hypothetical protein [Pseudomonadota bacterium]